MEREIGSGDRKRMGMGDRKREGYERWKARKTRDLEKKTNKNRRWIMENREKDKKKGKSRGKGKSKSSKEKNVQKEKTGIFIS